MRQTLSGSRVLGRGYVCISQSRSLVGEKTMDWFICQKWCLGTCELSIKNLTGSEKKTESVLKYEKVFLRYPEVYIATLTLWKCVGHQLKYETKLALVDINHCNEEKQIRTCLTSQWKTQIWEYSGLPNWGLLAGCR